MSSISRSTYLILLLSIKCLYWPSFGLLRISWSELYFLAALSKMKTFPLLNVNCATAFQVKSAYAIDLLNQFTQLVSIFCESASSSKTNTQSEEVCIKMCWYVLVFRMLMEYSDYRDLSFNFFGKPRSRLSQICDGLNIVCSFFSKSHHVRGRWASLQGLPYDID